MTVDRLQSISLILLTVAVIVQGTAMLLHIGRHR
jgi:hypothetical protein